MKASLGCKMGVGFGDILFSLMSLIGDPIYQYFSKGFQGPTQLM